MNEARELLKIAKDVLAGRKPSRKELEDLAQAFALYRHAHNAPMSMQNRLYSSFQKKLTRFQDKYTDGDPLNERNMKDLEKFGDKWWNSRPLRGPGVDW